MIYKVKATMSNPRREVTTCIAGCVDEHDARKKFREWFKPELIHWAKPMGNTERPEDSENA